MHWFNATRSLFPTTAICAGMKMADQAVQHIDDTFRKHHPTTLLALPHRLLQYLKSSVTLGLPGRFLPLK